jgi:predicted amidohydrolase YtcJ
MRTLLVVLVVGLLLVGESTWGAGTVAATPEADLVLLHGKVITVDSKDTIAQAVAVKDGKIVGVGRNEDVRAFIGSQTNVLDLKGRTVTPGLVDSHIHVMYYGRQFWEGYLNIRFPNVRSKADLLRLVAERAKVTPEGEWISGNQGFLLSLKETPDRWELDSVSRSNPVYLRHASGQYAVANSYALRLAGINRNTPNPYGGVIERDPTSGEPTGILFHYPAENLVGKIAIGYGQRTNMELMDDVRRGQDLSLAAGYTSGQDVIVAAPRHVWIYRKMSEDNALKMRLYLMEYIESEEAASSLLATVRPLKTEMLTFGGWKLAVDGGPAAGTSLMYDTSLPAASRSYLYHDQETLNRIVSMLHKAGFQVAFHVGGDRAIDMALNAIEAALKETPRENHRHRLEHVIFPSREALERIKKLGVVVSTQPQWISFHADGYRASTDEKTMQRFMPIQTMLDMGIHLAFGCDVPATIMLEPKWAFLGAVTRRTESGYTPAPEERISMKDALRIHTMGSAYASFEEKIKGSIEEGKVADMVVWSHDLYAMPTSQLKNLEAEITIVGGRIVYQKEKTETTTVATSPLTTWPIGPQVTAQVPTVRRMVIVVALLTATILVIAFFGSRRKKLTQVYCSLAS